MSDSETRTLLQQRGYSEVGEIEPVGSAYETTAVRNGSPVRVSVDPDSRAISAVPLAEDALNDSE